MLNVYQGFNWGLLAWVPLNEKFLLKHDSHRLKDDTYFTILMYLAIPVYDFNDILIIFSFASLGADTSTLFCSFNCYRTNLFKLVYSNKGYLANPVSIIERTLRGGSRAAA